jgi:hypothetical protein
MIGDMMKMKPAVAALVVAFVLVACGGGGPSDQTSPPTSLARPSSSATLSIVVPEPGATIQGGSLAVQLDLVGGRIIKQVSTNLKPDEGHIHLKIDGRTITLLGSLEETIPAVALGPHILEAEFVAADHGPFNPRVLATVTFTTER